MVQLENNNMEDNDKNKKIRRLSIILETINMLITLLIVIIPLVYYSIHNNFDLVPRILLFLAIWLGASMVATTVGTFLRIIKISILFYLEKENE